MPLSKYFEPRDEVFDESLDARVAPELHEIVLGNAPKTYTDPNEFFEITHFTEGIKSLVTDVVKALCGESGGRNVIILPSLFGGGKTHSLTLLYHVVRNPQIALKYKLINSKQAECLSSAKVVVIAGKDRHTAPSPLEPLDLPGYKVQTLWGYLAHYLGKFGSVEKHDANLSSPDFTGILEILGQGPVLILIDEIAHYLSRLKSSRYSPYVENVYNFLEILAEAVTKARAALVITVPMDPATQEVEKGYEEVVKAMLKRVGRLSLPIQPPISGPLDQVNVLKIRLFKQKGDVNTGIKELQTSWYKLKEHYKDYLDDLRDLNSYYPFHPKYVEVLNFLIDKLGLQKTRDLIRITRMVVRKLWSEKLADKRSLIVPADIRLEDSKFRSLLFSSKEYVSFTAIADRVLESVNRYPTQKEAMRELVRQLTSYVFLSTYAYDPGTSCRGEYPAEREVVSAVDFKFLYEDSGLTPSEAVDVLNALAIGDQKLYGLFASSCYGATRYWFTRYPDPIERCRAIAKQIPDVHQNVQKMLEDYIKVAVKGEQKRGKKAELPPEASKLKVYDKVLLLTTQRLEVDSPEYTLAILADEPTDDELKDLIFTRADGKRREYRNTIVVLHPKGVRDKKQEILNKIKEILGCESLDLEKEYPDEVQRETIKRMISEHIEKTEKDLQNRILTYLNSITYPSGDNEITTKQISRSREGGDTLLSFAIDTLRATNPSKLYTDAEVDFETLEYYLSNVANINISDGENPLRYEYIISLPYKDPRFPMFTKDQIDIALKDGVNDLKIGVRKPDGEVIFKPVKGLPQISINAYKFSNEDDILPWRLAVDEQMSFLLSKEGMKEGEPDCKEGVKETYFLITVEGEKLRLNEFKAKYPDSYRDVFKSADIEMISECKPKTFELSIEPSEVIAKPGEEIKAKVLVRAIGSFNQEVSLNTDAGSVSKTKGVPSFETEWIIKVPEEEGEYQYKIEASAGNTKKQVLIIIKVQRELKPTLPPEICIKTSADLVKVQGGSLISLEFTISSASSRSITSLEKALSRVVDKTLDDLIAEVSSQNQFGESTEGSIRFTNMGLREADLLLKDLRNVLGMMNTKINVKIKATKLKQAKIDDIKNLLNELNPADMNMCFKVGD